MHLQVIKDEPGKCPLCGMDLVPMGGGKKAAHSHHDHEGHSHHNEDHSHHLEHGYDKHEGHHTTISSNVFG